MLDHCPFPSVSITQRAFSGVMRWVSPRGQSDSQCLLHCRLASRFRSDQLPIERVERAAEWKKKEEQQKGKK